MSTDLENDLAAALRHRAGEVPDTPCPPLTAASAAPRRGWLVPTAVAAAVAGVVAAGVVLMPGDGRQQDDVVVAQAPEVYYSRVVSGVSGEDLVEVELWQGKARTDEWRRKVGVGKVVENGRVVAPDGSMTVVPLPESGVCYPAETAADERCTAPGSWFNPTLDFLAKAPRDPQVIAQQLHDEAVAEQERRTGPGGDFQVDDKTFAAGNLAYLELNFVRQLLTGNGVPADLEVALRDAVQLLPGVQAHLETANLLGEKGIAYSLPDYSGRLLMVIFDADGHFIGAPDLAVVHGFAPALGEPPSRLID